MTELKPCPFCGGEAELVYSEPGHEDRIWCIVRCKDWNCPGEHLNEWYATDDEAIGKWNTRYERTCQYRPTSCCTYFDEYGNEIETELADVDNWSFFCSECGDELDHDWFQLVKAEHGGYSYTPRFDYCPYCGAKVVDE